MQRLFWTREPTHLNPSHSGKDKPILSYNTNPATPQYLAVDEAAQVLGVNAKTVRRLIIRGELKARHVGRLVRIRVDALDEVGTACESVTR